MASASGRGTLTTATLVAMLAASWPSEAALTIGFDSADEILQELRRSTFSEPDVPVQRTGKRCNSLDSPACFGLRSDVAASTLLHEPAGELSLHKEAAEEKPTAAEKEAADPVLGFLGHYDRPGGYAFRVGDIVVHRGHGQLGVVAERFKDLQLPVAWFNQNAPPGMRRQQPFYSVLVSEAGFTRHAAQSSHRLWDFAKDGGPPPEIEHPELEKYFLGEMLVEGSEARYQPLDKKAAAQKRVAPEWDAVK